jgi:spermidine synthase
MQASGLQVKPIQLQIPSFINHDYGNWGFLLASETTITCSEIRSLALPPRLRSLNLSDLQLAFIFDQAIADVRNSVVPHQQNSSQLMFYLLNRLSISNIERLNLEDSHTSENLKTDFLNLQEVPSEIISNNFDLIYDSPKTDPMSLESLAQSWLRQIESNPNNLLIPAQHHSHTPEVAQVWLGRAKQLLTQIDFSRLIAKLLERSTELPQEIVADLHTLQTNFANFQQTKQSSQQEALEKIYAKSAVKPSFNLTAAKVIAILSLTLLVANLAAPDAVFAKGSTSSFVGSSSSDDGSGLGFLGLMMTVGGIFWLINLYNDPNQK